uniref:uncharacterized protein LOC122604625 n=1 Tax=Erigeron canadensis TaxID=72917 RepID=UPI001CB96A67|nr:uncharacterized protein LOC122604625 [Erigeron canadensis]
MAAIIVRRNVYLLPIRPFFSLQQGIYHKCVEAGDTKPQPLTEDDYLVFKPGEVDVSKWKKVDARSLGLARGMLPQSPYSVLQILRTKGFEAYLVGGCVRDLLLNRPPKDFDIITTADLNQIRKQFHRCEVVGSRFPVCKVFIKGSVVEVSSFDTLGKGAEGKEKFLVSQMPKVRDKLDLIRWKNSMHRDFTINSLFYDPFLHKIYDYNDGMKDLLELKLRTLVPAQLSFTEDSARILRGLRIAARLGLSLSKEIKSAILKQTSSVARLGQFRTMMELNYMLSFGAAESSLSLLHKYHLLEILLPVQALYISQKATRSGQSSMMLMELLSHLDKLVTCDRPSESSLWIALLGFHLALVNNPQHPFVILTFASVLYHQNWQEGLMFAREYGGPLVKFEPETVETCKTISDDEVAEKVNQLAMLAVDAIDIMVETDSLHKTMAKYPGFFCPGLIFIPHKLGRHGKQLFHILVHKVEAYRKGRCSFEINYDLLKKGDSIETRFALGKVILNTMGCSVDCYSGHNEENNHATCSAKNELVMNEMEKRIPPPGPPKLNLQLGSAPVKEKLITKLSNIMRQSGEQSEYQNEQDYHHEKLSKKHMEVVGVSSDPKNEDCKTNQLEIGMSESTTQELISILETVTDNEKSPPQLEGQNLEEKLEDDQGIELNESIAEYHRGTEMWAIQNNCRRAIEEARDSIDELSKLNLFLISFVEEQMQRKTGKHSETCSLESFPIVSVPKTTKSKRITVAKISKSDINSIMNGGMKKQRACSYCKEVGHNKIGCPKRKMEEASCRIDTEST